MKKFAISLVATLAMMAGFSSCSEDRDPVYQQPTEFVVNVPVIQDQYIDLDAADEKATISLVCSQPDYGYSAIAQYGAEVSLTEDFANFVEIASVKGTLASMLLSQFDISCAMTTLNGWSDSNVPSSIDYQKLYVRATCYLNKVEGSRIVSNVVCFNHVKPYFAVNKPGFVYLVGTPSAWSVDAPNGEEIYANWKLYEKDTEIKSKIYYGDFDFPAAPQFRFYTQLGSWDEQFSIGSQVADEPVSYPDYKGGVFTAAAVTPGKGSFEFPNFTGGHVYIKLDMSDATGKKLTIQQEPF